jgi:putative inorganic carbon (hco3(-)) transporter
MPIRDILLTAVVAGIVPVAMFNPFVGISLWTWISVMNPHRMTWDFAYQMPFAQAAAIATLFGLVFARKDAKFSFHPLAITLIVFMLWMTVTFLLAIHFHESYENWSRITKTIVMTLVAFAVVRSEKQIRIFTWLFVMCVAFFGIKGGIHTILTAGHHMVYGPPHSYIEDNNAISVALVMMIPLMAFLYQQSVRRFVKLGMAAAILLSLAAVLGSYSRTAFVAGAAMLVAFALKSRRKVMLVALMALSLPIMLAAMPEKWWERMQTIVTFATTGEYDGSVLGRINAWIMAWNLAKDRPIFGGGFAVYEPDIFEKYAPDPLNIHSSHSIYFQMLGEHGFIGLALFLLVGALAWRTANGIIRASPGADVHWRASLARAVQVSIVGFFVGGLAVNIGYWDVYYFMLVPLVAVAGLVAADRPARSVERATATGRVSQVGV